MTDQFDAGRAFVCTSSWGVGHIQPANSSHLNQARGRWVIQRQVVPLNGNFQPYVI
jgi:hypothetical protein